jgi:putative ABC transport system permease protein
VIGTIKSVEGVDEFLPDVSGFARIIGSNGKPVGMENGAPTAGSSVSDSSMIPWKPVGASKYPKGPDEVMINEGSAKRGKLKLGDK